MEKTVIIVAGGQGMRFGGELPKQFFYIRERPLMMHTIDLFNFYDRDMQIIIGLQEKFHSHWESVCEQFHFDVPHQLSPGGETRFQTVKNALLLVTPGNLVGIHDAVRPLIYRRTIDDCFDAAEQHGASLPSIELNDSIRELTPNGSRWADRDSFRLVQTPQVFRADLLKRAFSKGTHLDVTDDASLIERLGVRVKIVKGTYSNIKITTPEDLCFAKTLIRQFNPNT